jgi:CheY-like chemotaxis protein
MLSTKPTSVLIAEDDAIVNEGTAAQLARLGYSVAGCAYDGPGAVELANHTPRFIQLHIASFF